MKENAEVFLNFLIETHFLDTRSYFQPTNQNARRTTHNQSKFVWCHSRVSILSSKQSYWPMRVRVASQLFYKTTLASFKNTIMAELRRKCASGAPWVRFLRISIHARNFGYDVSVHPSVQTVGVDVARQDSLWARECSGQLWRPAFFWWEIILVKSNGIKIKEQKRAREKKRRHLRNLCEESL